MCHPVGDATTLGEAVDANRSAFLEFSRDQTPQEWAKAENNPGNALRSLGRA